MSEIDECVLKMRKHRIKQKEIAKKTGYTKDWVSMILLEKAKSDEAVKRIKTAINELIAEKERK